MREGIGFITDKHDHDTQHPLNAPPRSHLHFRNLTLHKLEVFSTVAKYCSVTRAAEHLNVAQPAVTAHLRSLEESLNVKLVEKAGRNIVLTPAGERAYFWAMEVLTRSSEMFNELADIKRGVKGHTKLSASMVVGTYALPDIIIEFNKDFPDINVSTSITSPMLATQSVLSGDCDFGVTILDPNQNTSKLEIELLWKEPLHLIVARNSALVGEVANRIDLERLPFITPVKGQIVRELIDESLRALGVVRTQSVLEFGHPEPILRAVRANQGAGFIFQSALPADLEASGLRRVQTPQMKLAMPLFLIHPQGAKFSQPQADLMKRIRDSFERQGSLFQKFE